MAVSTDAILDELGRAIELVSAIDDDKAREALRIVTQVGFVLAAEQHADVDTDDGYDADYLTEQDEDSDRVAEVVALNGQPVWQPEYDLEAHIERHHRPDVFGND